MDPRWDGTSTSAHVKQKELTPEIMAQMLELYDQGVSLRAIAIECAFELKTVKNVKYENHWPERDPSKVLVRNSNQLSIAERLAAFKMHVEGYELRDICKEIGISMHIGRTLKKEDEWEKRAGRIFESVLEEVSTDIAASLRDSLRLIQIWKLKMTARMRSCDPGAIPITMLGTSLRDFHDLEQDLISRVLTVGNDEDFSIYTDEQLAAMLRESDERT